jgi:UDP-2,4-diacetamido-2,4,6-trideoxy-beta-L-altropyranose hydrolase
MSSAHTLATGSAAAKPLATVVVDGGARLGFGHVGRCLALWEELGGRAVFAARDYEVACALRAVGAQVIAAEGSTPVVVIDRATATGADEVAREQAAGRRVCLIDDTGPGRGVADLVVDPPTGVSWPPAGGRRLAGFPHVLLRRELRAAARTGAARRGERGTEVLLSLGGSDPERLTPALAGALIAAGVEVVSALGPGYRGPRPPGKLLEDRRQWPHALARARLLVGRFGHTLLEAAHLGTPTLALAMDERAMTEAVAFAAHGTVEALRVSGPRDASRVAERAMLLEGDAGRRAGMTARGPALVDGRGAERVAAAVSDLARSELAR